VGGIPHYKYYHITPAPGPLAITMAKPMSVVEHADRLMQETAVLFEDKKSIMRNDYRDVVESQMLW